LSNGRNDESEYMKQGRFSEEGIVAILKESEAGAKVRGLYQRHGISDATFYT